MGVVEVPEQVLHTRAVATGKGRRDGIEKTVGGGADAWAQVQGGAVNRAGSSAMAGAGAE